MARERMVTRTVELTVATVMVCDTTTATVETRNFKLSGKLDTQDAILKAVKKTYETDTLKCVAVTESTYEEILYGMSEIDFIRLAKVLPPRPVYEKTVDEKDTEPAPKKSRKK